MPKTIIENGIHVYKNHRCICGCNKRIPYPTTRFGMRSHKYRGIPDYINGHSNPFKKGNKLGFKKGHHPVTEFKKGQCSINHPAFKDGLRSAFGSYFNNSRYRGLDCIPINEPFDNCECHHMTKDVVMFIPKWLHESIWHSLETGKNMDEMNNACYEWFYKQI
jgi:hypothetical protein